MSEEEESLEDVGEDIGSAFPHTPPLGFKAVRPGEDTNPLDKKNYWGILKR